MSLDFAAAAFNHSRMTTPRRQLVDAEHPCDYHLVSRCVRRSWLCGVDWQTRRDYSHRRDWLVKRLDQLVPCFAVDLYAYSIMDNHFHLVLRYDPKARERWSDEEVAMRWVDAFPPTERGEPLLERKAEARELMLGDPARLARARLTLGSLSSFMKHLKQPVARRANLEDDCRGHFFEQRFYSGALLSEEALVAAMAYVDLNPVRAGIAARIEECRDTSIVDRLQRNSAEALTAYLDPVMSGLVDGGGSPFQPATAQGDYVEMVRSIAVAIRTPATKNTDRAARWLARIATLGKPQRAYGPENRLKRWARLRGFQFRETPLPT